MACRQKRAYMGSEPTSAEGRLDLMNDRAYENSAAINRIYVNDYPGWSIQRVGWRAWAWTAWRNGWIISGRGTSRQDAADRGLRALERLNREAAARGER